MISRSRYVGEFHYCEACARMERRWPVEPVDLHHIFGGRGRVNHPWNIISLCREHHGRCTYHDIDLGREAKTWNARMLAIKLVKGELSAPELVDLGEGWLSPVMEYAKEMVRSEPYLWGLSQRWYAA